MKQIVLGSGGSAFVDGGIGAMHALNVFDIKIATGEIIPPGEVAQPKMIEQIVDINLIKENQKMLQDLEIMMPCDVNNPLIGLRGAAYVFGPQKGVKFDDLPYFDT